MRQADHANDLVERGVALGLEATAQPTCKVAPNTAPSPHPKRFSFLKAPNAWNGNAELISAVAEPGTWVTSNPDAAAAELSPSTGIPEDVLKVAISRQSFGVAPITDQVVADQQAVADTFHKLGLLPAPIKVADAVVKLS